MESKIALLVFFGSFLALSACGEQPSANPNATSQNHNQIEEAVCTGDADCDPGQVCEPTDEVECNSESYRCVPGCHEHGQCGESQFCDLVLCDSCLCPGMCRDIDDFSCSDDEDCAFGFVCEATDPGGCGPESKRCMPGCREASDCATGQACEQIFCDTCPCPGLCIDEEPQMSCSVHSVGVGLDVLEVVEECTAAGCTWNWCPPDVLCDVPGWCSENVGLEIAYSFFAYSMEGGSCGDSGVSTLLVHLAFGDELMDPMRFDCDDTTIAISGLGPGPWGILVTTDFEAFEPFWQAEPVSVVLDEGTESVFTPLVCHPNGILDGCGGA